jgi:hypothetical protein
MTRRLPSGVPIDTSELPRRLVALAFGAGALALLTVAMLLAPSEDGHGTHTRLGLPACGWVVAFDTPCPTCGMTTSYAHAVRGDLWTALKTQPLGTLLAVLTAATAVGGLHAAFTGCRLDRFTDKILSGRTLWITGGLALAAWVYKIATWT